EGHGDRSGRAGRDHQQERPTVQERREWTERLAEVDVTAPRPRPPGAKLAEGQRTGERDDAAGDPRGERKPGAADARGHHLGPENHAGPDDAADDRPRGGKDAEAARVGDAAG